MLQRRPLRLLRTVRDFGDTDNSFVFLFARLSLPQTYTAPGQLPTMSYNRRRYETLHRLGIEQLPTLRYRSAREEPRDQPDFDLPVRTMPVYLCQRTYHCTSTDKMRRSPVEGALHVKLAARPSGSSRARSVRNAGRRSTELTTTLAAPTEIDTWLSIQPVRHRSTRGAELAESVRAWGHLHKRPGVVTRCSVGCEASFKRMVSSERENQHAFWDRGAGVALPT